ncbi:MAG TPA: hypothetical protein V6C50_04270 [Crinalium sp.]
MNSFPFINFHPQNTRLNQLAALTPMLTSDRRSLTRHLVILVLLWNRANVI